MNPFIGSSFSNDDKFIMTRFKTDSQARDIHTKCLKTLSLDLRLFQNQRFQPIVQFIST